MTAELARLRQGLYRFFSGALAPPEPPGLEQLIAAAELLESLDLARFAFWREWTVLTGVLRSGVGIEALATEHVRLFGSGADGVLCPAIESYYRAEGHREATAEIVTTIERSYRELGVATAVADAPDHATTQLEIMATLCAHEAVAWQSGDVDEAHRLLGIERTFLHRHLAAWVPRFRVRGEDAAANDYYRAVLDAVHAFIVHDDDLVAGLRHWSGAVA